VDYVGPKISAAWLNIVDRLRETVFEDAATKAAARTALMLDAPLEITNGGTGNRTGTIGYVQTTSELAAGVTPADTSYLPGDSRRYTTLDDWALLAGTYELLLVGDYTITTAVNFPNYSDVAIRGISNPTVTVSVAGIPAFTCDNAISFNMTGVQFVGANSATVPLSTFGGWAATSVGLVTVTDSANVRIENCSVDNFYNGISVIHCSPAWVVGNKITGWMVYGILGSLCSEGWFDYNDVEGCDQAGAAGAYGIMVTGDEAGVGASKSISISFNHIQGIPSWDAIMSHDCNGLRIMGNDIRDVRVGIDVSYDGSTVHLRNLNISHNYIEATTTNTWGATPAVCSAIYVVGYNATTNKIDQVVVEGNICRNFGNISGGVFAGNVGIIVVANTGQAVVSGNIIEGTGTSGGFAAIYAPLSVDALAITGNTINGYHTGSAIRLAGSTVGMLAIDGNTIIQTTAADYAINISGSTVGSLALGNNATNSTTPFTQSASTITWASSEPAGSFMANISNSFAVGNAFISAGSKVFLQPTNAAAATLQAGASALYVSAKTPGVSFQVTTADGGACAGTETFDYRISY